MAEDWFHWGNFMGSGGSNEMCLGSRFAWGPEFYDLLIN